MGARPSFDMSKISTADKILAGAAFLFFIDTFLPWQRVCVSFLGVKGCGSANAWSGNGGWAGVLAGILSLVLVAWLVLNLLGVNVEVGVPSATVSAGLVAGTVLFGLLKFLLVIANHSFIGAWLGLVLLIAIAYGAYMKMQEPKGTMLPPAPPGPAV
jgi:hypothetical protein